MFTALAKGLDPCWRWLRGRTNRPLGSSPCPRFASVCPVPRRKSVRTLRVSAHKPNLASVGTVPKRESVGTPRVFSHKPYSASVGPGPKRKSVRNLKVSSVCVACLRACSFLARLAFLPWQDGGRRRIGGGHGGGRVLCGGSRLRGRSVLEIRHRASLQ